MFTIGKVATLAGVSPDTLRYYEKERLIAPASKTAAGYRLYNDDALRRIRFIKHAQHCGFTLSDIKELLTLKAADSACCEDVRTVAIEKNCGSRINLRHCKPCCTPWMTLSWVVTVVKRRRITAPSWVR